MSPTSPCRIVMYSHDAMGIGHVRRNLLVASALSKRCGGSPATLLIAGVADSTAFELPPHVDLLTLPALCKGENGTYRARRLPVGGQAVLSLRAATIRAAVEEFDPHVLIVDKLARGAGHELDATLADARQRRRTRCVLALRDVLDDPDVVRQEWRRDGTEEVVRTSYDAVWVYGSPEVYDLVREYEVHEDVARKVRYTGYLDRRVQVAQDQLMHEPLQLPFEGPFVLCMVGGGEDGGFLAEAFADAALPRGLAGVLLAGPFLPADVMDRILFKAAHRRAGQSPLYVHQFHPRPHELLARAERVVAMGGYNTVWETLSYAKPCLIAPRVSPRREQWIRAARLAELGLLDMIHPDDVTPAALETWLGRDQHPRKLARDVVDMAGVTRLPVLLDDLLGGVGKAVAAGGSRVGG